MNGGKRGGGGGVDEIKYVKKGHKGERQGGTIRKFLNGGSGDEKYTMEQSDGSIDNIMRERARTEIYRVTYPLQRISIYGKSTETGCIPMMVDNSAGVSQTPIFGRQGVYYSQ